ncbi:hypothetical protein L2E82_40263 [Cichorium intybus]|uniref:Uncharacterized protein n=1 Tax=Cichorium intybus TaxID=13427 RepID=A0ACB9AKN2_CICIN|nr:hypothetical protein L2E82_40263 [Cichorium intybus]
MLQHWRASYLLHLHNTLRILQFHPQIRLVRFLLLPDFSDASLLLLVWANSRSPIDKASLIRYVAKRVDLGV